MRGATYGQRYAPILVSLTIVHAHIPAPPISILEAPKADASKRAGFGRKSNIMCEQYLALTMV